MVKRASGVDNGSIRQNGSAAPVPPPELATAPGYLARRLHQAYLAAWVRNVDATLTGPQFAVLNAVSRYPGEDQGSLASSVALDRSTMADVVRRLEERGLVARESDPHDGRRKLLYLTDEGTTAFHEANRKARALDELLLGGKSTAEREAVLAILTELADLWETIAPVS
jgi:DNA-binding MarR family transcriptional regulator